MSSESKTAKPNVATAVVPSTVLHRTVTTAVSAARQAPLTTTAAADKIKSE